MAGSCNTSSASSRRKSRRLTVLFGLLATLLLAGSSAPEPAAAAHEPDYADEANWLCRPGRNDACHTDLDVTEVKADGTLTVRPFAPADDPALDCFYVYPTISADDAPNSDMVAGEGEARMAAQQFARFAQACRLYAPIYRQVTLRSLRAGLMGRPGGSTELAYQDVRAAFEAYLENDNRGRPFVLFGHSQGTAMLTRLIQEDVEGTPLQERMLSAILLGYNVLVPKNGVMGGSFHSVPLCTAADETGCVVTYVSFPASTPPPPGAVFAYAGTPGLTVACVNPASLLGRTTLGAIIPKNGGGVAARPPAPWVAAGDEIATPFVSVPGLLRGDCAGEGDSGYLTVTTLADPGDPRSDDIGGEVLVFNRPLTGWGLHLLDVNLTQADLIALVNRQAAAYAARRGEGD
ncbi:DUF3089 domain-containing protein [Parvularcula dongshanensis]|uniref:DUF3089 domain-containing protein n=1 Tax=Parvularcula dongshanensis TaxID=1173995 RepID=A0A840HZ25_9PROT|nr:DUF3089 domain-containing protein [Parvularcula dongshanensis]MBB4658096.1 hypothetical protein [Parvularcula dongshanensis]